VRDPTRVIWRRSFAFGMGALLTGLVLVVPLYVAGDVQSKKSGCPHPLPDGRFCFQYRSTGYLMRDRTFLWFAVALIVLVLVLMVVPQLLMGTSLGKAIFGVRVVRADGRSPGFVRSSIRVAAWLIDGLALLLPIGLWMAIFTRGHRRVGDYLAGTYVVDRHAAGHPIRLPAHSRGRRP
jgi:uncharacterized RDD family membrane protein YckC